MGKIVIGLVLVLVAGLWLNKEKIERKVFEPRQVKIERKEEQVIVNQETEIVAESLQIPWAIEWLSSGEMLVTERAGRLLIIGEDKKIIEVAGVVHTGEGGLMGMALHPDFADNNYIYLYLTSRENEGLVNRVERYKLEDNKLTDRQVVITGIKGAAFHDGGRIKFGPDGKLYVTTGDAGKTELAQDTRALEGKILRLNDDGSVPSDNPFGNAVWSYGHRNPQGIAWDSKDRLWASEHGPSGIETGNDEVNLIVKGGNYGWPTIKGQQQKAGMIVSVIESGREDTWAPASLEIVDDMIYFGGLRGEGVYVGKIEGDRIMDLTKTFGDFGRVREVKHGPDGQLYISTSNLDGRGKVNDGDDKIIKIMVGK